jgi:hypothetical protein
VPHTSGVTAGSELSHLADHDRAEVTLDTGLTYDGVTPVVLTVSKRDRRYGVTDGGGAIAAAGASPARVAFPNSISVGKYEANVSRHGAVCLSAVAPTPSWLETICDVVARGSVALYEELLETS